MDGRRAVVVGAGPNGLTAGALLARAGWDVEVHERQGEPGGAAVSSGLLGPGTIVDPGAASFPFGVASPAFRELGLEDHGLEWAHAPYPMAHPLDDRPAAVLHRSLEETADGLGGDGAAWRRLHGHLVRDIDAHVDNLLGPVLRVPPHPAAMARFGAAAALPAEVLARLAFRGPAARALFVGSAVHTIAPPTRPLTAAFGQLFGALGMARGWPVARGGTGRIVDALVSVLIAHGGRIHTSSDVTDLRQFADADAVILGLTPRQVLRLRGLDVGPLVRRRLERWRYGPGVHKVDFLLSGPVPWADERVAGAGTVHVCGDVDDVRRAEAAVAAGRMPPRPFVMVCQQQAGDPSRATGPAAGRHVLWTYAHVPHGYMEPMPGFVRERIVAQIERFAPGFRDVVVDAVERSPAQLEAWNPGLVGGDLAGGAMSGLQTVLRPGLTLRPHRLRRGLYLASGATSPGAGVHGMPGYWAARAAIRGSAG